jgi:hypothetical protein
MLNAGSKRRPPMTQEITMNTTRFAARRLSVPAVVTAAVAVWFVLASGVALADGVQPGTVAAPPAQVTLTPQGAMKLTVVAVRPAAQVTMTPEGSLKITVIAQRPQEVSVRTASARHASQS